MAEHKKYAQVTWCAEDIQTIRPEWTDEQAEEWLASNEKYIQSRMIEVGWEVIETLIGEDEAS
jgi:hypothetical protein